MAGAERPTQIRLLGGFRVIREGSVVLDAGWNRRKALALLKIVAVRSAGQLHRDQVCEALWPDLDPRAATNNLHKNLHYLRTALDQGDDGDDGDLLSLSGDVVCLHHSVSVDLHDCLAAAAEAQGSRDVASYDHALALAEHELLPEDVYEEWVTAAREELASVKTELLREVVTLHIQARRWDAAIQRTRELVEIEPTDEDAHRALMQLYVHAGSRHRALRQFEICRDALERELGVEPSPQTVALHVKLLEEAPSEVGLKLMGVALPPVAPQAATRPLTYGRERELEVIESALDNAADGRGSALFLLGEAGIGKSHLLRHARAAAEEQGALALYGRAFEFDARVPYQPLRGMLREVVRSPAASHVEPLVERSLYLRRLLPEAAVEAAPTADTSDLQTELFEEAWRLFAAVAATQPVVLLFDDLHDADEGSLRAVHFLARRAHEARLLVVCAARPERPTGPDALGALRAALRRDGLAREEPGCSGWRLVEAKDEQSWIEERYLQPSPPSAGP